MRVLVSGTSGLVGRPLVRQLHDRGYEVYRLIRDPDKATRGLNPVMWHPRSARGIEKLNPVDAVIHLAGENILSLRWTAEKRSRIRHSRVVGTKNLISSLNRLGIFPKIFISASAIGYYGNCGDQICSEDFPAGEGFLADVVREWEEQATPLVQKGARVVHPRIGLVLSKNGGALRTMLFPFHMGLGGKAGSGNQWMSWISITDVVNALIFCLENQQVQGPVNLSAPNPVTNREFTKTLAEVIERPAFLSMPGLLLQLLLGQMAKETVLSSIRTTSQKLESYGFSFTHQTLRPTLEQILDKNFKD